MAVEAAVFVVVSLAAVLLCVPSWRRWARLVARLDAIAAAASTGPAQALAELPEQTAMPLWKRLAISVGLPGVAIVALVATGTASGAALFPLALLLAGIGFAGPGLFERSRARRRRAAILRSLPDVLDLLIICIEAGLGLNAAFQRVAERIGRSAPELGEAFRSVHQQIQAGRSREEALRAMAVRVGVAELRTLAVLLIQTDRLGTSVADALRIHAEALRTRFHHDAESRAAKATVYLAFPLVFCIFPALLAVVVGPAAVKLLSAMGGKP